MAAPTHYHCYMRDLLTKSPVDVASLARAPIGELSFLPAACGIYLAIDAADRVWYVGKAVSIRERLNGHEKMAKFSEKKVAAIAFQTEADEKRYSQLEVDAIKHFHPPLNDQHNFNELPRADFGLSPEEEIERFFLLRIDLKMISLELAALAPNIVSQCEQAGGRISHQNGSLWYVTVQSWKYSEECEKQKQELLRRQKDEREKGTALVTSETTSPRYKLNASALAAEYATRFAALFGDQTEDGEETL
jgi:hypothetical protein